MSCRSLAIGAGDMDDAIAAVGFLVELVEGKAGIQARLVPGGPVAFEGRTLAEQIFQCFVPHTGQFFFSCHFGCLVILMLSHSRDC